MYAECGNVPDMIVLDPQRDEGNVGLANTRDLSNHISYKREKLIVVVCEYLDADVSLAGGTSHVADRFIFRNLLGNF